jgi:hypothetical protein
MRTLKLLQDYASTTENTWLQNKLDLLEMEVYAEVVGAEVEALTRHLNK